jgi:lipopolysaccharide/colanic/teichoic acid biosynthesis glycosyltransferase
MSQGTGERLFDLSVLAHDRTVAVAPPFRRAAKRSVDLVLASFLLIALAPVIAVVCVAIKLESRGPCFYRATRVGWHGSVLYVLKFRKMRNDATGQPLTGRNDPRFTRLGHILAKTKLDEVPQLWNVARGQMSLVGPRPEAPEFVALHEAEYREILSVRPGISGLCQLAFSNECEILNPGDTIGHYVGAILPQKVRLDQLYATSWSLRGDLRIIAWTILPVVLRVDVAVNRATGALTVRRRRGGRASD